MHRFAAWPVGDSLTTVTFMAEQGIRPPGHLHRCDFFFFFPFLLITEIEKKAFTLKNKVVKIGSVSQYTELTASSLL